MEVFGEKWFLETSFWCCESDLEKLRMISNYSGCLPLISSDGSFAEFSEFFFIDTTPFEDKYFTDAEEIKHPYDWRRVLPREEYLSNQLKDLDAALKESNAGWKIVWPSYYLKCRNSWFH